jgi:hypothetical protein
MKDTIEMIEAIRGVECPVNSRAYLVIEEYGAGWRIGWRHRQEFYPLQSGETFKDAVWYSHGLLQNTGHIPKA